MSTDENNDFGPIAVPLAWVELEDAPIALANQFALSINDQDEWLLNIGQARPPVIIGSSLRERQELVEKINFVPIFPVARISLTRKRVEELQALLERQLTMMDGMSGEDGGDGDAE